MKLLISPLGSFLIILFQSLFFSVCFFLSLFQQPWMLCNRAGSLQERSTRDIKAACFVIGLREGLKAAVRNRSPPLLLVSLCLFVSSLTRGIWRVGFIFDCFCFIFSSLFTFYQLPLLSIIHLSTWLSGHFRRPLLLLNTSFFEQEIIYEYFNINQAMCIFYVCVWICVNDTVLLSIVPIVDKI